jgi:hypothetical protein
MKVLLIYVVDTEKLYIFAYSLHHWRLSFTRISSPWVFQQIGRVKQLCHHFRQGRESTFIPGVNSLVYRAPFPPRARDGLDDGKLHPEQQR